MVNKDDELLGEQKCQVVLPASIKRLSSEFREFWMEKYLFNVSTLGLTKKKAREWATRTVDVCRKVESELGQISKKVDVELKLKSKKPRR